MSTKVFVADSQYLTRHGLVTLINNTADFEVVRETEKMDSIQEILNQIECDLIILDVAVNEKLLFTQIDQIQKNNKLNFLILVDENDKNSIRKLIKLKVKGIISKRCNQHAALNAFQSVAKDERFYCNTILDIVLGSTPSASNSKSNELTPRELEVLKLIGSGKASGQIAAQLFVSVHTINSHRKSILKKLDMKSPAQLIAYAFQNDLLN